MGESRGEGFWGCSLVTLYIQRWLARANKEAVAECAEKKNARDRSLLAFVP